MSELLASQSGLYFYIVWKKVSKIIAKLQYKLLKSKASTNANDFYITHIISDEGWTGSLSAVWACTFSYLPVKCLTLPPSSRGLGHQPFKLKIRGSNPLGGIFELGYLLTKAVPGAHIIQRLSFGAELIYRVIPVRVANRYSQHDKLGIWYSQHLPQYIRIHDSLYLRNSS